MHGRLKVKTSAEQEAEKKKEKLKKLEVYTAGIEKANDKRNKNELDDEAMDVVSQLLLANPEFYTMWNFRKEIICHWKTQKTSEEFDVIMKKEIEFTESCLRVNPKSYGSWYHRLWTLQEMTHPNWKKELLLCNKYLEVDERNFHCWNYRFMIAKFCQVTAEDELGFSDLQITKNFSNYSSWHYRSKLLPSVFPDPDKLRVLKEDKLMQELELVQNAAFTDPEDQSVWFYHQWLLGHSNERKQRPTLLHYDRQKLILVLSGNVLRQEFEDGINVTANGCAVNLTWTAPNSENASPLWISSLNKEGDVALKTTFSSTDNEVTELSIELNANEDEKIIFATNGNHFNKIPLTEASISVLKHELDSVNQLLELEPDSKWPLLTSVLLMRCIHFKDYEQTIFKHLEKLITVDYLRADYYRDLRSKYVLENECETFNHSQLELNLSNLLLTKLYHSEFFFNVKKVNLSTNLLQSMSGMNFFINVRELLLDSNAISSCDGLEGMAYLQILSLQNNKIADLKSVSALSTCAQLTNLNLKNNLICDMEKYSESIKSIIVNLKELDGTSIISDIFITYHTQ